MSKQSFISIPLDISDMHILQADLTQADELILTVESIVTTTKCRRCGRTLTEQHGEDGRGFCAISLFWDGSSISAFAQNAFGIRILRITRRPPRNSTGMTQMHCSQLVDTNN